MIRGLAGNKWPPVGETAPIPLDPGISGLNGHGAHGPSVAKQEDLLPANPDNGVRVPRLLLVVGERVERPHEISCAAGELQRALGAIGISVFSPRLAPFREEIPIGFPALEDFHNGCGVIPVASSEPRGDGVAVCGEVRHSKGIE